MSRFYSYICKKVNGVINKPGLLSESLRQTRKVEGEYNEIQLLVAFSTAVSKLYVENICDPHKEIRKCRRDKKGLHLFMFHLKTGDIRWILFIVAISVM